MVHFAENEAGYCFVYRYVCKHDNKVFHSESHPNLTEAGSPGTKQAMRGYAKRRRSQAQQKIENSNPTVTIEEEPTTSKKTCHHLTITAESDVCIEDNIKNRTQLLLVAAEQKRHGKLDICTQPQQKGNP